MNPTAFATAFRHWGDTREGLHLDGVLIALPLRTERRQQPWRHHRSRSRQRVKDEKIGMRFGRLLNLRSEEHTSELQSRGHLVCRLLLEKKNKNIFNIN